MSIDITSYLISQGVNSVSEYVGSTSSASTDLGDVDSADFATALTEAITDISAGSTDNAELSEMQSLIESLDKSILGTVMPSLNSEELAKELIEDTGAAKEVISELTTGHMQALVTTDTSDDDEAENSISGSLSEYSDTIDETETLSQNLETIIAGIGTNITN